MDKNFLNEHKLNEDVKRFKEIFEYKTPRQSLKEYSFFSNVNEDDDEQAPNNQQQPNGGGQQPMQGQQPQMQSDAGGQPQMGGGMPPMQGGDMSQGGMGDDMSGGMDMGMGDQQPMQDMGGGMPPMQGGDMSQGGMGDDMGENPPMEMGGEMAMDDMGEMEDGIDTEEMESEDEVIDVDDLTQSQEATEHKIEGVDDRLSELMDMIQQYSKALEDNARNIESLKAEFEKRNPTDEERLNIRSQSSYPYTQLPKDYWAEFEGTRPNYNIISDNSVQPSDEEGKYELRKRDLDGIDMKSVADTLNIDQKLSDYLDF